MAAFGKFHLAVGRDSLNQNLLYMIVENGNFVFTNGHVLGVVPVDTWVDDLEGYSEGKAFDYTLLRNLAMEKYKKIVFTEKTVQAFENYDSETPDFESPYSGERLEKSTRTFVLFDKNGNRTDKSFYFPHWKSVVPNKFESKVSDFAVDPELLSAIYGCFQTFSGVKMFFGLAKPIKVVPIVDGVPDEKYGWGLIMPIEFK